MQTKLTDDAPEFAHFDTDRKHRYVLRRKINAGIQRVVFVMLNPSTADETEDDPTIRRCKEFAKRLKAEWLEVVNLLPCCTPYPKDVKTDEWNESINWHYIAGACQDANYIIAAWGANADKFPSTKKTIEALKSHYTLHHLGLTKKGQPRHPLYLKKDAPLEVWID